MVPKALFLILLAAASVSEGPAQTESIIIRPKEINDVLANPGSQVRGRSLDQSGLAEST